MLLLPTDIYISSGVLTVVLTILALIVLPASFTSTLFTPKLLLHLKPVPGWTNRLINLLSLTTLTIVIFLLFIGFTGTHDPLRNLLPLSVWTVFWIALVSLHGVLGNVWRYINPWCGIAGQWCGKFALPDSAGCWPGLVCFLLFSSFTLADTAPEDPFRLATVVTGYLLFTLICCYLFGTNAWLARGECFSMVMQRMAAISPLGLFQGHVAAGFCGWKGLYPSTHLITVSGAVFTLALLAIGSFDGLNETFWWLQLIGINPLEFPGRSAVIFETVAGLLISALLLIICFVFCVWTGSLAANRIAGTRVSLLTASTELSIAILPIALAYHIAHYLTAFMVNIQYTVAALTDPLQNGRDLLGLGRFYVTTGFFNTQSSVRTIWLTQAASVVVGHVISILLAHRIALRLWPQPRAATVSQAPMAAFMVLYTLLGLWLLAAPRGA